MKVIKATQQMLETRTLVIGFQGENLRTQLRIDCAATFAEYPNATPALAIKPPTGETYPVFVDRDGTEVVWDIVANNLILKGDGELQLTFYKDNVIAKTSVGHITVNRSLQIDGEMPDVVATWIENANRKLAEVDAQIVELEGMVDTATDAATRAEQSASTASTKAEQAAGSAATATEKATEATNAAGTATAKAAEAQTAAQTATDKANSAAESERIATAKAGEATTAAGTATAKAEQATEAAQTATEKAGNASALATAAHASEINAAESADGAFSAEVGANAAKRAAETSATQAGISEQNAGIAAQTATQKAAEATQSATNAAIFAGTATTKAEEATEAAQSAQEAKTAVEQTAEQFADSLEQIEQNKQDIAELDERKANIDGYYPDMTVGNAEQLNSSKFVENREPYTLRTSGGTSDIGNREYLDAVVGGTLAWNQAVRDSASENSTDFADVVTVTDAVEDVAEVKVKIEPVQDLHGYDHPWPAGGGVNRFDGVWESGNLNGTTGEESANPSFSRSVNFIVVLPNTAYYVYGSEITNTSEIFVFAYRDDGTYISYQKLESNGTYTTPSNCVKIRLQVRRTIETVTNYLYAFNYPNTVTTYSPYSNICPITGFDKVELWDDPKYGGLIEWNQLVRNGNFAEIGSWEITQTVYETSVSNNVLTAKAGPSANASSAISAEKLNTVAGHKYLASIDVKYSKIPAIIQGSKFFFGSGGYDGIFGVITAANTWQQIAGVFTRGTGGSDKVAIYPRYSTAQGEEGETAQFRNAVIFDLTRMFGSTVADYIYSLEQANAGDGVAYFRALFPADYYPYNAGEITIVGAVNGDPYRHYSITLPTEAGTVYGGTLAIAEDGSGVLTVTHKSVTYTGASGEDWSVAIDTGLYRFQIVPNDIIDITGISKAVVISNIGIPTTDKIIASIKQYQNRIWYFAPSGITTVEQFRTWLASNNMQVVYELATPITYTLTASQICTLLGTNNVWADTGDLALTYTGTDEHLTLESGKKYLARLSGTDSMLLGSGQEITAAKGTDNVFDLTKMFGTAVADYVYGQGAAFFRKWFPNAVYSYNAGELKHVEGLQSHDMVGFNVWDEEWELGTINPNNGQNKAGTANIRSTNYIPVFPNTEYFSAGTTILVFYYDEIKNLIRYIYRTNQTFITPDNCRYIRFNAGTDYGTTYKHDICISLAHNNSRNGEYEPYEKHSYPLDSTVVLRGIPKVGANGVYWDGDRYLPDGTVERRYGIFTFSGNENWEYIQAPTWARSAFRLSSGKSVSNFANGASIKMIEYSTVPVKTAWNEIALVGDKVVGTITQSAGIVIRDDSITSLSDFRTWINGKSIVYELATPTTETAQPYHSTQWVNDWGTEEFVSTGLVPVGHETRYPANLRDKLQHLPDAASGNGSYLISQTDGQMVLTPFPAPPSSAGNYVLKATVTGGVATYTWEVAT